MGNVGDVVCFAHFAAKSQRFMPRRHVFAPRRGRRWLFEKKKEKRTSVLAKTDVRFLICLAKSQRYGNYAMKICQLHHRLLAFCGADDKTDNVADERASRQSVCQPVSLSASYPTSRTSRPRPHVSNSIIKLIAGPMIKSVTSKTIRIIRMMKPLL